MAGLMALLTILTSAPARLEGRAPPLELPATAAGLERAAAAGVWVPPTDAIRQLLDLTKQGGWVGGLHRCCQPGGRCERLATGYAALMCSCWPPASAAAASAAALPASLLHAGGSLSAPSHPSHHRPGPAHPPPLPQASTRCRRTARGTSCRACAPRWAAWSPPATRSTASAA